ncbi:sugar-binding domain-containing protein [Xylanibacter muris]|uniref:beta-galactosidase n=1 Tax=Xylanibacter muris TaxID=2736290 RepID=A0ABX2AJT3_9BACT|nr:sugar-binding domain-containing protein [Xylanibacter muris]NPD91325.1 beta-glucuronidase [Xylanibacter muris]
MNKRILTFFPFAVLCISMHAQTMDISGKWNFAIGGDKPVYNDEIVLPGSMLTNGKGDDVTVDTKWTGSLYDSSFYFNPYMAKYRVAGKMKFPFFLTPSKHYVGDAWYGTVVNVPKEWKKRKVFLYLERPHIETTVYINGEKAGRDSSLSVGHEFDITPFVKPGAENRIDIRVYNGIENVCVGQDSHSVTDQTQGNWNGIAGRIELVSRPAEYINNVQVYPNISDKSVELRMSISGGKVNTDAKYKVGFRLRDNDGNDVFNGGFISRNVTVDDSGNATVNLAMGDGVKLWDEFNPMLYTVEAVLNRDTVRTTFGMREITIKGRQFYMNGIPIWIRGTVGNCCFPLTGYPPTDEASWMAIFRKCKEYGLNMMRFHSYCPPEAAFAAADKVGFYLQPEGPSWPNHGVRLGRGMTIDKYLLEETRRMVEAYGNHPSFCMLAAGNEPAGDWVKWVGNFVDYWKQTGDRRRVYCGASVGGGWAFDPKSEYHVKGGARGLDWNNRLPQSEDDYYQSIVSFTQKGRTPVTFEINEPYLSHEQGQWCAFPDLKETVQYTGAYKAGNFEIFSDLLRDNGMAPQAEKFLMASGRLQTLAYKYELERNLRTKDYAGFQLLGLNDYSGQGTALVGVLNVFWREKGYCSSDDWTQFCSAVVPLARFPKFVYSNEDTLSVPVELYNAYNEPLHDAVAEYTVTSGDRVIMKRSQTVDGDISIGKNNPLCDVAMPLADICGPSKLKLSVTVRSKNAPLANNSWEFWVYPSDVDMPEPEDVFITDTLDAKAVAILEKGGKVLVTAAGKVRFGNDVKQTYLPVFWNTSWFKMRPPHTTGAYIDNSHPLFRYFPTDEWSNLNWWELLNKAQVMNLSRFPHEYQPAIQPIDTWHVSRKLGMMIEANVLGGKLLMTTMDISNDLDRRLVARQMRKAILNYMQSESFVPSLSIDPQEIFNLFENEAQGVNMFTSDSPDELKPKLK